jgi:hypothetical protein
MSSSTTSDSGPAVVLGEVRTTLLRHSGAIPANTAERLLRLVPGQAVLARRHPMERIASPERLTGVDCPLASWDRSKARGIGTVLSRATVTGGRILQGTSWATLHRVPAGRRLAWGRYLGRPGVIEVMTRAADDDLADGFLDADAARETLDLGAIAGQVMESVQASGRLDNRVTVRARTHRLRWVAFLGGDASPKADIRDEADETFTTVRLRSGRSDPDLAARFCEDFALHEWLLSTLQLILRQAMRAAAAGNDPLPLLRPALSQLVHLWMPGVGVDPVMARLWEGLERHPGYSKQYDRVVTRIRDEIGLMSG